MTKTSVFAFLALLCIGANVHAHGPEGAKHQIAQIGDMTLESGAVVKNVKISYATHGKLNAAKDNAILVLHGFGANHHGFDGMIGSGKALDTDKYFVISPDQFGNTQVGFEHSTSPTNSGMKMNFPQYNLRDMIQAQHKLVTEALGIRHVRAVLGISMGGTQSLQYAVMHPDFMDSVVPIVATYANGNEIMLSAGQIQSIIESCAAWNAGNYTENSTQCAAAALWSFAHYFFSREWWETNIRTRADFEGFRKAWTEGYFGVQDMRDLHYLTKAIERNNIGATPGFNGDLDAALKTIKARVLFVHSPNDMFFLPQRVQHAAAQIKGAQIVSVNSEAGHLMCCGVDPQGFWIMGEAIRGFLNGDANKTAAK